MWIILLQLLQFFFPIHIPCSFMYFTTFSMKLTIVNCVLTTYSITGTILFLINPLSLLHSTEFEKQWSGISLPPQLNHVITTVICSANTRISSSVALKATDANLDHNIPNSFIQCLEKYILWTMKYNNFAISTHHFTVTYITAIFGYPLYLHQNMYFIEWGQQQHTNKK